MPSHRIRQLMPPALIVLVVGLLLIALVVALRPRPEPRPEPESPPPQATIVLVQPQTRALPVFTQGTVAPLREIELISQVGGRIVEAAPQFASGGFFAADDWLVRVDPRDYQFALARAEARLRDAEMALASERGLARQAQREWRDLGNPEANELFLRKPQLAAAQANVEAAQAERAQAQLELERTEITVPFAGRIRTKAVDVGQHVSPGTPVARIFDAAAVEVRLPLTDRQANLLNLPLLGQAPVAASIQAGEEAPGQEAPEQAPEASSTHEPIAGQAPERPSTQPPDAPPQVILRGTVAGRPHQWPGQITRTEASLDPQSRQYYAIAEVADPFNAERHGAPLLVGAFVEAEIAGREIDNVVELPRTAVILRDQIYTLDPAQQVQQKTVRVLHRDDHNIWVQGALSAGEAVIVERHGYFNPGMTVTLAEDDTPTNRSALEDQARP